MNYLATCVCGQQFMVNADQVGRHVTCPGCSRALIPIAAEPRDTGAAGEAPASMAEPTKRCPYCGENILAVARKCRFCGEFLDRPAPAAGATGPAAAPAPSSAAPATPAASDEPEPAFELCVSQWDNFWKYLICLAIVVATVVFVTLAATHWSLMSRQNATLIAISVVLLVGITAYFFYLSTRTARCAIRPTRIDTVYGVFSKKRESVELSRVAGIELKQGFVERVLGIGTILVTTTNENQPTLELYQIPKARKVYKYLQEQSGKVQISK
jgi:membrane protein YdbS with pleckstrin-like domain